MPVTIENPILNSPFEVPARHWHITREGIEPMPVECGWEGRAGPRCGR